MASKLNDCRDLNPGDGRRVYYVATRQCSPVATAPGHTGAGAAALTTTLQRISLASNISQLDG